MDYRKFLGKKETLVLPCFGGLSVDAEGRRLRLAEPLEPGWYSFEVTGRRAAPLGQVEPPELSHLPKVRGHLAADWLFASGTTIERLNLMPAEQPPALSPCHARRWHGGELLFDSLDWEQEAELAAREALEEGRGIADLKGIAASLRAAFGYALLSQVCRERNIPASPREVLRDLKAIAETGRSTAEQVLTRLQEHRQMERHRRAIARGRRAAWIEQARRQPPPTEDDAIERAASALEKGGARLRGTRELEENQLEVTFGFLGERFVAIVDAVSLQVFDAGICLSGHDREIGLDSLPSVIREAIDRNELNITRS